VTGQTALFVLKKGKMRINKEERRKERKGKGNVVWLLM
jgi:hypothetical protein